jgi:hypothetical protein
MSVRVGVSGSLRALAEDSARRATQIVMGELSAALQQSFTAPVWAWPRPTVRSGGVTVGSPRNIIDTATLRQSHTWAMSGPYQATYSWSAQYASVVHDGAVVGRKVRTILPARPWTRAVIGTERVSGIDPFPLDHRLRDVWLGYMRRG